MFASHKFEKKGILIDPEDKKKAKEFLWDFDKQGYIRTGKYYPEWGQYLHQLVIGRAETGFEIDHINGDKSDNRKENLRTITHRENMQNTKTAQNRTKPKGVYIDKDGRIQARLKYKGKAIYLGYHKTIESAAKAVETKEKELFG